MAAQHYSSNHTSPSHRTFSFETGSEPSRFFRSEMPRTIAQPTETWLLDRYAQPRLFFNDFHVRWTNVRGPARGMSWQNISISR